MASTDGYLLWAFGHNGVVVQPILWRCYAQQSGLATAPFLGRSGIIPGVFNIGFHFFFFFYQLYLSSSLYCFSTENESYSIFCAYLSNVNNPLEKLGTLCFSSGERQPASNIIFRGEYWVSAAACSDSTCAGEDLAVQNYSWAKQEKPVDCPHNLLPRCPGRYWGPEPSSLDWPGRFLYEQYVIGITRGSCKMERKQILFSVW